MFGPGIFEIIPIDHRDDGMLNSQMGDGFSDIFRFVWIHQIGSSGGYIAKTAAPGANVAEDHESRCAFSPTLADVRAIGALTNGMEIQV